MVFLRRKKKKQSNAARTSEYKPPIAPHILFFFLYNAIYYMPLLLTFIVGFSEGGIETFLDFTPQTMAKISWVYFGGFFAFLCGAKLRDILRYFVPQNVVRKSSPMLSITLTDKACIAAISLIFVFSKIAIIPLGVYQSYAFDTDQMTQASWTFSTVCSESLLFISILVLFSKYRRNVLLFSLLTIINGINLLHGTRFFFIIGMIAAVLYAYIRGLMPLRKALILGPLAFSAVLGLAYLVFLGRASVTPNGDLTAAKLLSPLVFESVFSQISLIGTLNQPNLWGGIGSSFHLLTDAFLNTMPRLLAPDKEKMTYIAQFAYLSPLGAFNGYADGLLYLGKLFPLFYFALGLAADWLYVKARRNGWWFVFYAYFTADSLFRVMRDGYLIPIKMLINCAQIVCALLVLRFVLRLWRDSLALPQVSS